MPRRAYLHSLGFFIRSLLAPPDCELCGRLLQEESCLCRTCAANLPRLASSRCELCAAPFPDLTSTEHRCGDCLRKTPSFSKASCAFLFEAGVAQLLHRLKFSGQQWALDVLAPSAALAFRKTVVEFEPEWLVPVPLPWWRRFRRGFNQSTAIAMRLLTETGFRIPIFDGLRRRPGTPQALRTRQARRRALRGLFRIKIPERLRGRRLLIVDDVMTTGATAESLSKTLLQAGAKSVQVFALARTPRREGI